MARQNWVALKKLKTLWKLKRSVINQRYRDKKKIQALADVALLDLNQQEVIEPEIPSDQEEEEEKLQSLPILQSMAVPDNVFLQEFSQRHDF